MRRGEKKTLNEQTIYENSIYQGDTSLVLVLNKKQCSSNSNRCKYTGVTNGSSIHGFVDEQQNFLDILILKEKDYCGLKQCMYLGMYG